MNRIIKGDSVLVTAGKSKGQTGEVLVVDIKNQKAKVKGANLQKKTVKANPQQNEKGGIVEREAFIHLSNLSHYDPETNKPLKVGFKFVESENKHKRKV